MNQTFTNLIIWLAVIDSLFLVSNIRYLFKKDAQKSLGLNDFCPVSPSLSLDKSNFLVLLSLIFGPDCNPHGN